MDLLNSFYKNGLYKTPKDVSKTSNYCIECFKYVGFIFYIQKEENWKQFKENDAKKGLANIEKLISLYGRNGFSVGDSLLWSDLCIYDVTSQIFDCEPAFLNDYKAIQQVRSNVEANTNMGEYLKSRKAAPF